MYMNLFLNNTALGEDEEDIRIVSSDTTDFMWAGFVKIFPISSVKAYKWKIFILFLSCDVMEDFFPKIYI